MKTAFIGHRDVFAKNIAERLLEAIRAEIDKGCRLFTMGTHGEFDSLALNACRELRKSFKDLEIEVVITSLNVLNKKSEFENAPYADVNTVMYNVEDAHYKQRIILSNRRMIDNCDTLICYVDTSMDKSGAKLALRYAEKLGIRIVILYCKEDQPFDGMAEEEIDRFVKNLFESDK